MEYSYLINVAENAGLITLKLKTTQNFVEGSSIMIALMPDPLNEIADGSFNVIDNVNLQVDIVDNLTTGVPVITDSRILELSNYPNPFSFATTIAYTIPTDGKVTIKLYNELGQYVSSIVDATQSAGKYTVKLDGSTLQQGVYSAILRLNNKEGELVRSIKLVVSK